MKKIPFIIQYTLLPLLFIALVGCNMPRGEDSNPTLGVTQAYQTVEARLTQAAALTPINSPLPPPTATKAVKKTPTSDTPTPTETPKPVIPTATTAICDQAAAGNPIDVTIPDDTKLGPEQTFTKTWRLLNSGTCAWSKDYSIALFSGEAMSAPGSVSLPNKVDPGQSVDISVDMVAPKKPGTYQGNWKLRNASSVWFGIGPGGGSPFWVRIVVSQNVTVTTTLSPTPSPTGATATPTNTPPPGSSIALIPNDKINLDTFQINSGAGDDLAYKPNEAKKLTLIPVSSARIAIYGDNTPTSENCQAADLNDAPILVKNMHAGLYLCYRTDQGFFGWIRMLNWDPKGYTLIIQAFTWK